MATSTEYDSYYGTTEIRVTGERGGVVLNVGGQCVTLPTSEAHRLGRMLIGQASQCSSVASLHEALVGWNRGGVAGLYAEALS